MEQSRKVSAFEPIFLAATLIATVCSQLRLGKPAGIAEILLLSWVGRELWLSRRTPLKILLQENVLASFWLFSWTVMAIGSVFALWQNLASEGLFREIPAYLLAGSFSVALFRSALLKRKHELMFWIAMFASFGNFLILALALRSPRLGPFQLIDFRFNGLTENPNQIAFMISLAPFFAIYSMAKLKGWGYKFFGILSLPATFIVELACGSDALLLAWIGSLGIALMSLLLPVAQVLLGYRAPEKKVLFGLTLLIVFFGTAVAFSERTGDVLFALERKVFHHGFSADDRAVLWDHGIMAIKDNLAFGWGPGAHSGFSKPFGDIESHSSYIDWTGATGIFGLFALGALLLYPMVNSFKERNLILFLANFCLIALMTFHVMLRHPLLWAFLVVLLSETPLNRYRLWNTRGAPAGLPRQGNGQHSTA